MTQEQGADFSNSITQSSVEQAEHFRMSDLASSGEDQSGTDPPSVENYHPTSDRSLLAGGHQVVMARKGCCLYFKICWCLIGVLGGLSIFVSFFFHYKNYNGASWGFMGGVLAGGTLHLHILYLRDKLNDWYNESTLTKLMYFSFVIFVLSSGACVTYLVLAITKSQSYELEDTNYYPAATFSFYSIKWSLTLMWEARSYRYILSLINPILVPGMTSYSGTVPALDAGSSHA